MEYWEELSSMINQLKTEADVVALVHEVANQVHDPCGLAQGFKIGITDRGLMRSVKAQLSETGWIVAVRIRLTSPGCLYYFYFEQELRQRLTAYVEIAALEISWDEVLDWTPDDLSEAAQVQFKAHYEKLQAIAAARQSS
jgi:metal-sulfur cluster biosynthetic enzyme